MYFRQEGESIGIGSYLHEPLLVDASDLPDRASRRHCPQRKCPSHRPTSRPR